MDEKPEILVGCTTTSGGQNEKTSQALAIWLTDAGTQGVIAVLIGQ